MMQGFSPDEKRDAMSFLRKQTPGEHAAITYRCSKCMRDPHTAMKGMDMSKVTEKMKLEHMLSGMNKGDQKILTDMMAKATPTQKSYLERMMMNCCMYGMKHAKQ